MQLIHTHDKQRTQTEVTGVYFTFGGLYTPKQMCPHFRNIEKNSNTGHGFAVSCIANGRKEKEYEKDAGDRILLL